MQEEDFTAKKGYRGKLEDGRDIYIPNWPVDVALENLNLAGKVLGVEQVVNISALNVPAVIVAIMGSDDHKRCSALVKHFICQVRIDGDKITPETINQKFEGDLHSVAELFTHVIHSQYHRFFESGLAKANSPAA